MILGADLTTTGWLEDIPADRSTMIVVDGLMAFLSGNAYQAMTRALTAHFSTGELAVLAERAEGFSAVQRLALVDAAAWWLTDPAGDHELAHALIDGACADRITAEHATLRWLRLLQCNDATYAGPTQAPAAEAIG